MWPMITAAFIYGCLAGAVWRATAKVWLLPVPLTLLLLFIDAVGAGSEQMAWFPIWMAMAGLPTLLAGYLGILVGRLPFLLRRDAKKPPPKGKETE